MKDQTSKKLLAFLTFASSSVSAFCLGIMAFTLTTGELPFGIAPLMVFDEAPVEVPEVKPAPPDHQPPVDAEKHAVHLFNQLQSARNDLASEERRIEDRRRYIETMSDNVGNMQAKLDESEARIRTLLDIIEQKEVENVRQLTKVVSGMEVTAGAEMLMAFEDPLPSRVLYYMKPEKKTAMLTTMMRTDDVDMKKRAVRIAEGMQRISEELNL